MEKEILVGSPEGAEFLVEQNLYDGADANAALIITTHQVGGASVSNFWIRQEGVARRVLEERVLEGHEPSVLQLHGEVIRIVQQRGPQIAGDTRLKLGVLGLSNGVQALRESGEKEIVIR